MTQNQIAYFKAKEEAKHWERQDAETGRHNVRTEDLTAEGNKINETHYLRQDTETQRHNYANESLQQASVDTARYEAETHRQNLYETTRHNKEVEQQNWKSISETQRHDQANEHLGMFEHLEDVRHNQTGEALQNYANITNRYATVYEAQKDKAVANKTDAEGNIIKRTAGAQVEYQEAKTKVAKAEARYASAKQFVGIAETGSNILKNLTGNGFIGALLGK